MKVGRSSFTTFFLLSALLVTVSPGYSQAAPPTLTRAPYIQRPTTSSVTVVWETDAPAICSVEHGPTPEMNLETRETSRGKRHEVELTGLRPGAEYYYRIVVKGVPLAPRKAFRTNKDESQADFSFVVFGDTGTGGAMQKKMAAQMLRAAPDFGLHTGDVVYPAGEAKDYEGKYFQPYQDMISSICVYPTPGNHDYRTDAGRPYFDAFSLPANNPADSEKYYSFDYANAHIVSLDSNLPIGGMREQEQFEWLKRDLAATRKLWKFVFLHHPPYSHSNHGSSTPVRNRYSPLFERHAVDIVFSGHDHNYQRTVQINESSRGGGVIYIVTGGGGAGLYDVGRSEWTAFARKTYNFVSVSVKGSALTLSAIDDEGKVFDGLSLGKGAGGGFGDID